MNGIIAEIKDKKAVLLTTNGEFSIIPNKNYTIGQKIEHKVPSHYKQIISIAACILLFMCAGFTGHALYFTPTSYVSMDINPSVHLEINRFNKIIQAKPLNNDAKRLLSSMNIAYQDTAESMNKIIDTAKSMGYLTDKNKYVVIDCYTNEDSLVTDVSNNTKKYSAVGIDVIVEKASKSELDLSNKLGISMGRAKAIKEYSNAFGGDIKENASLLSHISVGNVKKMVKQNDNTAVDKTTSANESQNNTSADNKNTLATNNKSKSDSHIPSNSPDSTQKSNSKNNSNTSTTKKNNSKLKSDSNTTSNSPENTAKSNSNVDSNNSSTKKSNSKSDSDSNATSNSSENTAKSNSNNLSTKTNNSKSNSESNATSNSSESTAKSNSNNLSTKTNNSKSNSESNTTSNSSESTAKSNNSSTSTKTNNSSSSASQSSSNSSNSTQKSNSSAKSDSKNDGGSASGSGSASDSGSSTKGNSGNSKK